ncbi:MAG: type II toxin-antitoxin system death-on-curing family toxin [Verrucomicrobiales bacterium]|nr:type II toxin-antitoxin system death-on-curing family toxin [Verrucomicrobiales bacterium]
MHEQSLARFGGSAGIRDLGQVESALGAAMNMHYYGQGSLFDVAAAYAFHIAESQAFLDGNKRTAVASGIAFLELNGFECEEDDGSLYDAMIGIAEKRMDKTGLAAVFRGLVKTQ